MTNDYLPMTKTKNMQILVVEDNNTMRMGVVESLKREGFRVTDFDNGKDALDFFRKNEVPLVITDLKMEPVGGIELLKGIKQNSPATEVLIISAYGTVETAVQAMQLGAADFLTKPFSPQELRVRVNRIVDKIKQDRALELLREENRLLQDEIGSQYEDIIGRAEPMQQVFSIIERVAGEDSTVLIEGESGTGKELVARAIHRKSGRADKPFIKINCGALNDNLLESELFGHEKGAFTGAIRQKKGRFEMADGGTLFLDEIGDVSPTMQIKLLRVLQEMEFERVGGEKTISVDVRIISATNRELQKRIAEGDFREDLFYRLSVIPIKLPALRQRKEDIPLLVNHFLKKLTRKKLQPNGEIAPEGMKLLVEYSWPGNIRELENLVERLVVISPTPEIEPQLIARQLGGVFSSTASYENLPLEQAVNAFEKNLIIHALKRAGGIKNQAAKLLGLGTSTLYYKMEKFGLLK